MALAQLHTQALARKPHYGSRLPVRSRSGACTVLAFKGRDKTSMSYPLSSPILQEGAESNPWWSRTLQLQQRVYDIVSSTTPLTPLKTRYSDKDGILSIPSLDGQSSMEYRTLTGPATPYVMRANGMLKMPAVFKTPLFYCKIGVQMPAIGSIYTPALDIELGGSEQELLCWASLTPRLSPITAYWYLHRYYEAVPGDPKAEWAALARAASSLSAEGFFVPSAGLVAGDAIEAANAAATQGKERAAAGKEAGAADGDGAPPLLSFAQLEARMSQRVKDGLFRSYRSPALDTRIAAPYALGFTIAPKAANGEDAFAAYEEEVLGLARLWAAWVAHDLREVQQQGTGGLDAHRAGAARTQAVYTASRQPGWTAGVAAPEGEGANKAAAEAAKWLEVELAAHTIEMSRYSQRDPNVLRAEAVYGREAAIKMLFTQTGHAKEQSA